ncbi:hypothetical protein TanjilG_30379 [Lupinus angustifolius]|uniref:midasin-like n=1 Tax=Lupinus angustifolius TaxID=3871 RepID=UPI00090CFF7A|nr:PREDICTED: midasin-like [Lupinus angustifolius]XP_019427250.1 PREDICTED: midasin-like [Lupinus angustifolius]OIV91157.1 hypothetical protein TanjilG_30379 [Lupinus angustifolius]
MIKRLPSRNQRSKGFKVKHVIQVILLLGVCFWLIYQVKHNHDKKKELDENDAILSAREKTGQVLKLGRKDLPVKDEGNQNEGHEEEEDENIVEDEENKHGHNEQEDEANEHETGESDENKHGVREQGEEENKHGAEEQEDENKSEEMEDEGRGGGDDEIDENDQEKPEVDVDRDEEFMDEEKEKEEGEEKGNENSEGEEKGGSVENHNTHEAREEHYKGDDASSAVVHDTHTTSTETETFTLENTSVQVEENITKPENKTSYSDESNRNQNNSKLKVAEGELTDGTSSNATAGKETENNKLFNSLDDSYLNKTAATNSDSHLEASGNMTAVATEASNNFIGAGSNTSSSSEQNKTIILPESDHAQNTTADTVVTGDVKNVPTEGLEQTSNEVSERNQPDTNSTVSVKTEHGNAGDAVVGESSKLGAGELEKTIKSVATNETENNSRNLNENEMSNALDSDKAKGDTETSETNETQNIDATEDEMFKGTTQTDETLDSSLANGTSDSVEHGDDSSDSHIHEDATAVQTDLDTLPDIRNEGDNAEDEAAAE